MLASAVPVVSLASIEFDPRLASRETSTDASVMVRLLFSSNFRHLSVEHLGPKIPLSYDGKLYPAQGYGFQTLGHPQLNKNPPEIGIGVIAANSFYFSSVKIK